MSDDTLSGVQKSIQAEKDRVASVLARDAKQIQADRHRDIVMQQKESGGYVNVEDLAVRPTDEWMAKGDVRMTLGIREDWMERAVKTPRRDVTMRIVKLYRAGVLDDDRLKACKVYADAFERSGLDGAWASSNLSGMAGGDKAFGHMAKSEAQAEAVRIVRLAREWIDERMLTGFDMVVLGGLGMKEASGKFHCTEKTMRNIIRLGSTRLFQLFETLNMWGNNDAATQDVA